MGVLAYPHSVQQAGYIMIVSILAAMMKRGELIGW